MRSSCHKLFLTFQGRAPCSFARVWLRDKLFKELRDVNFGVAAEALRSKAMRMKADYATIKTSSAATSSAAESMAHKGSQEQQGAQASARQEVQAMKHTKAGLGARKGRHGRGLEGVKDRRIASDQASELTEACKLVGACSVSLGSQACPSQRCQAVPHNGPGVCRLFILFVPFSSSFPWCSLRLHALCIPWFQCTLPLCQLCGNGPPVDA